MRRSGSAATSETAFIAIPPSAHRRTCPNARTTGSALSSTQCQVIAAGSPIRRVSAAASVANGLITPMWMWATSKPTSRLRRWGTAKGLTSRLLGNATPNRCTVMPSSCSVSP